MLRIVVNNKDLDLNESISIPIKAVNPMFSGSSFPEVYSFSFDVPVTNRNIKIFESAERLDSTSLENEYDVKIYHSGIFILNGVINVRNGVTPDFYKCNLNSKGLWLAKKLNTVNLQELDLDTYEVVSSASDPAPTKVSTWETYLDDFLNNEDAEECTHCFPPIKFEDYISPYGDYVERKNLVWDLFHIYNGANWFADENYRMGSNGVDAATYGENFLSTVLPVVKYMYALNKALIAEGVTSGAVGDFCEIADIKQLSIVSNTPLDNLVLYTGDYYNTFNDSYSLQNHLPSMTALDLITGLKKLFGVIAFDAIDAIELIPIKDIVTTKPIDLTVYASPGYVQKYKSDEGYILSFALTKNEERVFDLVVDPLSPIYFEAPSYTVTIGNGGVKSESKNKPTLSIYQVISSYADPAGTTGYHVSGKCHFMLIEDENFIFNSPFTSREGFDNIDYAILTFYRGKCLGDDGKYYPCATYNNVLSTGRKVGAYTLEWDGKDGLYQQWWKPFVDAINGKKDVERSLIMPIHKIKEMLEFTTPNYTIKGNRGNMTGIIKEVQFTLGKREVSAVNCTFVAK